jgi:hypothetical protein
VYKPGTYFLDNIDQIMCCNPFKVMSDIHIINNSLLYGSESEKIAIAQKILKTISNMRNIQKGILNRYHFLWKPILNSSNEWAS